MDTIKITVIIEKGNMEATAHAQSSKSYVEVNKILSDVLNQFDEDEEHGSDWEVYRY